MYLIPGSNCDHVYTGESKRTLKVWMAEHRRVTNNGIGIHASKSHVGIDWAKARVVSDTNNGMCGKVSARVLGTKNNGRCRDNEKQKFHETRQWITSPLSL